MDSWTIFYWGWWIAWAPFVGMFIAKISRGRTVRQIINGSLTGAPLPQCMHLMHMWLWPGHLAAQACALEAGLRQASQKCDASGWVACCGACGR
jgi:choline-glycine betaine transporter